jgi:two-component system, LytTR family, sensor kinase
VTRFPAPPADAPRPPPPRAWRVFAAFWTASAIVSSSILATAYVLMDRPAWEGAVLALDDTAGFAVLTLAAYACAKRFPVAGERRTRNAAALLACMAASNLLWTAAALAWWAHRPWLQVDLGGREEVVRGFWGLAAQVNMIIIPLFVCAQGLVLMEMRRVQEVREEALRTRLARLQLQGLRQQLRPEFLFGVFDSVGELMPRDRDAADAMLSRVAEMLRIGLRHAAADEVALQEEWRFTELYLQIECARLEGRLRCEARLDPRANRLRIPHMVLQPLVENAVMRTLANGGGTVELAARRLPDGALRVEVMDDVPAACAGAPEPDGIARAREHLERLYGDGYALEVEERGPRGSAVRLTLPQPPAADAAPFRPAQAFRTGTR